MLVAEGLPLTYDFLEVDNVLVPQIAHDSNLLHDMLSSGGHLAARPSIQAAVAQHGLPVDDLHRIQLLVLAVHTELDLAKGA